MGDPHEPAAWGTHSGAYDFPADRDAIAAAVRAGWNWRRLWRGSYRAEAVALLTSASP